MKKMENCSIAIESIQLWIHPFLTQWNKINWFDLMETAKTKTTKCVQNNENRERRWTKTEKNEYEYTRDEHNEIRLLRTNFTFHAYTFSLIDESERCVWVVCAPESRVHRWIILLWSITLWSSLLFAARLVRERMGCMCTDNIISSSPSNIVVSTSHTRWPLVRTLHMPMPCIIIWP